MRAFRAGPGQSPAGLRHRRPTRRTRAQRAANVQLRGNPRDDWAAVGGPIDGGDIARRASDDCDAQSESQSDLPPGRPGGRWLCPAPRLAPRERAARAGGGGAAVPGVHCACTIKKIKKSLCMSVFLAIFWSCTVCRRSRQVLLVCRSCAPACLTPTPEARGVARRRRRRSRQVRARTVCARHCRAERISAAHARAVLFDTHTDTAGPRHVTAGGCVWRPR